MAAYSLLWFSLVDSLELVRKKLLLHFSTFHLLFHLFQCKHQLNVRMIYELLHWQDLHWKKTQLLKQTKNNNISLIIHLGVPE